LDIDRPWAQRGRGNRRTLVFISFGFIPPPFCIEFTLDLHILVDRMLTFVLLIVGFALLIKGVDFLIEGAIYE
jgi:hypothetical protein